MVKADLKTDTQLPNNFTDTQSFADNLAESLRMAELLQRDFLPSQLPDSEKLQWSTVFIPAECVSGDIYDVARLDENHIGFYIADVVGHGMPAALLTMFLKQALVMRQTIANTYHIFSPSEVLTALNLRLTEQKLSGSQFITCCYCLLNTDTLQLTYARAGHPYPILIRPNQDPQQLEIKGSLLGIFETAEFGQHTIQLQPGDKLMLYSDGSENIIGYFDDLAGFNFNKKFAKITELPIQKMMDRFTTLIQHQNLPPAEIDDVTAVAVEILK